MILLRQPIVRRFYSSESSSWYGLRIHTGLIFLEGKEKPNVPPGYGHDHFEEIMIGKKKED